MGHPTTGRSSQRAGLANGLGGEGWLKILREKPGQGRLWARSVKGYRGLGSGGARGKNGRKVQKQFGGSEKGGEGKGRGRRRGARVGEKKRRAPKEKN